MQTDNTDQQQKSLWLSRWKPYLKKLGVAGFMFFLIKGLVWVVIFLFIKSKI